MNNEDLQVLEHVHMVRQRAGSQREIVETAQAQQRASADQDDDILIGGVALVVTVKNARRQVEVLTAQLSKLQSEHNDVTAVALSANAVIDNLVSKIADLTHAPIEAVRRDSNELRTATYDAIADEWLEEGTLVTDPRQDPEVMEVRDWYVK